MAGVNVCLHERCRYGIANQSLNMHYFAHCSTAVADSNEDLAHDKCQGLAAIMADWAQLSRSGQAWSASCSVISSNKQDATPFQLRQHNVGCDLPHRADQGGLWQHWY